MNESQSLPSETVSPETYNRCSWGLATGGAVIVFFLVSWLSIQRAEILIAQHREREAEEQTAAAQGERDEALRERAKTVRELNERNAGTIREMNERIAKSDAARFDAEKRAREMAAKASMVAAVSKAQETPREKPTPTPAPMRTSEPTAEGLTMFIKAHLSHMMESVEAQLGDYAENVDFHDKPHASLRVIETDRSQWAQRYPVRAIFKDEIQPQLSAVRDAAYGWIATATFNWRWEFRTRTGAVMRGVVRDTWKIAPTPQGLKIISEHSADPVTGVSKD